MITRNEAAFRSFWFCFPGATVVAALLVLAVSLPAVSQSTNASLSGTVSDAGGGLIPGTTVTATNNATGVVTTVITNEAGVYNFPNLLPGAYKVSATQPGFQTQTYTDVQLGQSAQVRLNFTMQVSTVQTSVEVSVAAERTLLESSSSVGDALPERTVEALPLVNRNVLDLVKVMSGVVMTDNTIFNANESTFAGISAAGVNIQRDGIAVNDVRWPTGINTPTRVNPDLVSEFRMILAPVDAEVGRGNGQIQILTKSGSNEYHGAAVWNVQNTALDPNSWANNRAGIEPRWRNLHQYTGSFGGPIIKNKTFFFALYDGQVNRLRAPYNALSLTPCAQRGIFRYFDNWNNGNARAITTLGATPTRASVDTGGNPIAPATNPDGTPFTGTLRYASVFGQLAAPPTQPDCSDAQISSTTLVPNGGTSWDPNRTQLDTTGFIKSFMQMMPQPNNYDIGDGLNTVGSRWTRTLAGVDNLFGVGEDTYRKQINVRIDHYFNKRFSVNGSWSFEDSWADDNFKNWPNGYGGKTVRQPQVLTINVPMVLSPSLLNEARFGMSRTGTNVYSPYDNPDTGADLQKLLQQLVPNTVMPTVVGPGDGIFAFSNDAFPQLSDPPQGSNFYGGRGILSYSGKDNSPRYTFGDTLSWTKAAHSFKFGGEVRQSHSLSNNRWTGPFFGGYNTFPFAEGGSTVAITGIGGPSFPGLAGTPFTGNTAGMQNMLTFLAGSLSGIRQWYFINAFDQTGWNDPTKDKDVTRDFRQNEFSVFVKDDWKIRPDLTLNLGLRYEYYGIPYITHGLTAGLQGGGSALFGISGRGFENWTVPGPVAYDPNLLTQLEFIGPGSNNTGTTLYPADRNNFGPAIGFSWQVPWFGKGKTTIRGGYQVSFLGNNGRAGTIAGNIGQPPGSTYSANFTGTPANPYLDLTDLPSNIPAPIPTNVLPGIAPIPLTDRVQNITVFDPNYVSPYVQNLTLAITRNVTRNVTVDVRYIGTLTRKMFGSLNINQPNFTTNGLLQAFTAVRAGGDSDLLNSMLTGINLAGTGCDGVPFSPTCGPIGGPPVAGIPQTAGVHMRASTAIAPQLGFGAPGAFTQMRINLANGDFQALANQLNVLGFPNGQYLRNSGQFPENFIKTNPQFQNATYDTNDGYANYHSLQAQLTLQPLHGVNLQGTYTWSRNLGLNANAPAAGTFSFTDPTNRAADYTLLPSHREHNFAAYGSWDLPFGPGRAFAGNSTGFWARLAEGWQTSWILNLSSGQPLSITAQSQLYGLGVPDVVGPFNFKSVGVSWPEGAPAGNYFGNMYKEVRDPQCLNSTIVAASLQAVCSLQAVADSSTNLIVLQTPMPGTRGTFGQNRFSSPGRWNLDAAIAKRINLTESKKLEFRIDASNVFNHPMPTGTLAGAGTGERIVFPIAPDVNLTNPAQFGNLEGKVGGRTFQGMLRFQF
jgi:Carboxypeptidase regulatory-like domain